MAKVDLIEGDTALTPDQGITFGSLSIQNGGMQLRQAAATARNALLDEAAKRLNAGKADLVVEDGVIRPAAGTAQVSYAELVGGKPFALKLDDKAPVKNPADFKLVGKPVPRIDIPDKVTRRFTYAVTRDCLSCTAPTVSAIVTPRRPSGSAGPLVVSTAG
jgi:hypothetical protein